MAKKNEEYQASFKITTPANPGFEGVRGGVMFAAGAGQTDDEDKAIACLNLGYTVVDTVTGKTFTAKDASEPPGGKGK